MKRIIFSAHALQRCDERGISESTIIQVIEKPDYIIVSNQGKKELAGIVKERKIHVVLKEEMNTVIVVTVY